MDDMPAFGDWLRRRRKVLDLTQEALAQRVGCSVVSIRKFEGEEQRPSRPMAARLAAQLELPPEQHLAFVRYARGQAPDGRSMLRPDMPLPALPTPTASIPDRGHDLYGAVKTQDVASLPRPGNLPTRLSSFLGREEEQRELRALLQHPEVRLLTLRESIGVPLSPIYHRVYEQILVAARAALGDASFDTGQALTEDQAVAEALALSERVG